MDVMKIETHFMKSILNKLISRLASKKLGQPVSADIKSLQVTYDDKTAKAHLEVDISMNKEDFQKALLSLVR